MTNLDFLRQFAKRHPHAPIPGGLWLDALAEQADTDPVGEMDVTRAARFAGSRSEAAIRKACRLGLIPGAYQESAGGRWRIPLVGLQHYLGIGQILPDNRSKRRGGWKAVA